MIKNILFDLGGIVIDLDIRRTMTAFARLAPDMTKDVRVSANDLLGGGDTRIMQAYQTGTISTEDFFGAMLRQALPGTTLSQLEEAWNAMLLGIPAHRLEEIHRLHEAGYKIYILSNINEVHVNWTLRHFAAHNLQIGAGQTIEKAFFSNEIHLAKPDAACYELVIREAGIRPEETLYIDDLEANIQAGRAAGFCCLQVWGDEWLAETAKLQPLKV